MRSLAEFPRAVERIDDPDPALLEPRTIRRLFFGEDRIRGPSHREGFHDERIGDPVARAAEGFALEEIASLQRQQQISGDLRDPAREGRIVGRGCRTGSTRAQPEVSST